MPIFHLPPTVQKMVIKQILLKNSPWDLLCIYCSMRRRKERNKVLLSRKCWMMMRRGAVSARFLMLPTNLLKSHHLLPCLNLVMNMLWSCSHVLIMPLFKSFTTCLLLFSIHLHFLLGCRWFLLGSESQQKIWWPSLNCQQHCRVGNCVVMDLYSSCCLGTINDVWIYWLYLEWLVAFGLALLKYCPIWQWTCKNWNGVRWKIRF